MTVKHFMKEIILIIFIFSKLGTAYSQDKRSNIADTVVFVNFNETDLSSQKVLRLEEARQQNRISDAWDLKQFYPIDSKWFKHYTLKLNKELKKGKINHKFISEPSNSSAAVWKYWSMTTDFKVEESKNGKYLMIYMISTLLDKDGKRIMDGDATGIMKKLRKGK